MEKSLDLKHIRMNDDNYQSESPTISGTYNAYSSEIGRLWSDTAHLYTTSSHTHKQIFCFNTHDTLDVHSPYHTPDQLIKTHPSTPPLSSTCSSDFNSPSHLAPFSQSILNSFNQPPTSSFSDAQPLPEDDDYAGPITYEIFMKQQQEEQQNKITCCCHLCQNETFSTSQSIDTIPKESVKHQSNDLTTSSLPLPSPILDFPLLPSIPTNILKANRRLYRSPYRCSHPGCEKIFSKPSYLRCHEQRHLGIKPHSCTWPKCGQSFVKSDELTRHYRRHTGVKQFSCKYCNRAFTRCGRLSNHMKSHFRN